MGAPAALRVVHLCRVGWPAVGGMERVVSELAARQAAAGHVVRVIVPGEGADAVGPGGVPYRRLPAWRGLVDPGALRASVVGADLLHVHGVDRLLDEILLTKRVLGIPVAVSTHGAFFHGGAWRRLRRLRAATTTRWMLRRADAVWFTSIADRDRLGDLPGARVLGNGLELDRLLSRTRIPERGRWLVLGRVDHHKGLDDLIEAVARVPVARRGRLEVVGPTRDPELVRRLSSQAEGRVELVFRGEVLEREVRTALARAELALFPSRSEGFGLAVVQAMAAGVPTLVRPIAAHRELVEDGRDGWWVPFEDPAAAAARLEEILEGLPAEVEAARETARRYSWEQVYPRWEAACRELVWATGSR